MAPTKENMQLYIRAIRPGAKPRPAPLRGDLLVTEIADVRVKIRVPDGALAWARFGEPCAYCGELAIAHSLDLMTLLTEHVCMEHYKYWYPQHFKKPPDLAKLPLRLLPLCKNCGNRRTARHMNWCVACCNS